ncbi:hypothetical protein [Streptomyces sp. NPDC004284]|uniref:hypothetical protein n=1 Tax=Streptomyces sp. NPDC004284 TaxID=3364695 RepID=UPI0036A87440
MQITRLRAPLGAAVAVSAVVAAVLAGPAAGLSRTAAGAERVPAASAVSAGPAGFTGDDPDLDEVNTKA